MAYRLCILLVLLASHFVSVTHAAPPKQPKSGKLWVFIGTYTDGVKSKGIYRALLDLKTGKLSTPKLAAETDNPSFLAIHPSGKYLYAVNEVAEFKGKKTGAVTAFALNPKTGELKKLNQQPSAGAVPCHIVIDKKGKHALVANYTSGSAAVLAIKPDGSLGKMTGFVQHKGSSFDKVRQ